ncbi:MAG: hypothetical protein AB8H80_07240 [Planctomycetota bacterium]
MIRVHSSWATTLGLAIACRVQAGAPSAVPTYLPTSPPTTRMGVAGIQELIAAWPMMRFRERVEGYEFDARLVELLTI